MQRNYLYHYPKLPAKVIAQAQYFRGLQRYQTISLPKLPIPDTVSASLSRKAPKSPCMRPSPQGFAGSGHGLNAACSPQPGPSGALRGYAVIPTRLAGRRGVGKTARAGCCYPLPPPGGLARAPVDVRLALPRPGRASRPVRAGRHSSASPVFTGLKAFLNGLKSPVMAWLAGALHTYRGLVFRPPRHKKAARKAAWSVAVSISCQWCRGA